MMQLMVSRLPPTLSRVVQEAAQRLTADYALRVSARVAVGTMIAMTAWSAAGLVVPVQTVSAWTALAIAGVMTAATAAAVLMRRRTDPLFAARILDRRVDLEERASTAVELALAPSPESALGARVIADASQRLGGMDIRAAFPLHLPRITWWIPALALLLAVWPRVLGGLTLPGSPAHRVQEAIRHQGARLEQFAQTLESFARAERAPATRRAAPQLRDLGLRLQRDHFDRAQALARIADLSRELELAQQRVDQRVDEMGRPPASSTPLPSDLFRREAVQRQLRQLAELTARLPRAPAAARKNLVDQLGRVTREGEGTQSAQVRQQLEQALRQMEAGDTAGARESLTQAMRMLEGTDAMLADREGVRSARQQLDRASAAIASGSSETPSDEPSSADQPQAPRGPGSERPEQQPGADSTPPPPGPWEGSTPGTGRVDEKLGMASSRLPSAHPTVQVPGAQGDGDIKSSEILGPGRPGSTTVPVQPVTAALVVSVDRALERAHIPLQYRMMVHNYFTQLAEMK